MTALMRDNLVNLFNRTRSAHAGLLMQKGLSRWDMDNEKPIKKALIDKIAGVQADNLYLLAFNRWLDCTFEQDEFAHLSATVNGRLFAGLALGGAIETGAMVHHTYGMPMIAGSSIKGAVRTYAETVLVDNSDKQAILNVLFGTESDDDNAEAGYLIWHDAWWIPNVDSRFQLKQDQSNKPFVGEIVTVHHQQYYQGKLGEALDIENPIPNQQIAMTGSFYFTIQGDKAWAEYALELLKGALQYQGLGAKGSNGYGYFVVDGKPLQPYKDAKDEADKLREAEENEKKLQQEMSGLSEIEQSLLTDIHKHRWKEKNSTIKNHFTENIVNWLDRLEQDGNQGAVTKFFEIANIHYADQLKKPAKAKPNQQKWLYRLLDLKQKFNG